VIPDRGGLGVRPLDVLPISGQPFTMTVTGDGSAISLSGNYCPPLPVNNFAGVTIYYACSTAPTTYYPAGNCDYDGDPASVTSTVWGSWRARLPVSGDASTTWTVWLVPRTRALNGVLDPVNTPHMLVAAVPVATPATLLVVAQTIEGLTTGAPAIGSANQNQQSARFDFDATLVADPNRGGEWIEHSVWDATYTTLDVADAHGDGWNLSDPGWGRMIYGIPPAGTSHSTSQWIGLGSTIVREAYRATGLDLHGNPTQKPAMPVFTMVSVSGAVLTRVSGAAVTTWAAGNVLVLNGVSVTVLSVNSGAGTVTLNAAPTVSALGGSTITGNLPLHAQGPVVMMVTPAGSASGLTLTPGAGLITDASGNLAVDPNLGNVLLNPGFTNGLFGWNVVPSGSASAVASPTGFSSANVCSLAGGSVQNQNVNQGPLFCSPGQNYTATVWVSSSGSVVTGGGSLVLTGFVAFYNKAGTYISQTALYALSTAPTTPTKYSANITTPANCAYMVFYAVQATNSGGFTGGSMLVGACTLQVAPAPASISDSQFLASFNFNNVPNFSAQSAAIANLAINNATIQTAQIYNLSGVVNAQIASATITWAQISTAVVNNLSVTNAMIQSLDVAKLTGGNLTITGSLIVTGTSGILLSPGGINYVRIGGLGLDATSGTVMAGSVEATYTMQIGGALVATQSWANGQFATLSALATKAAKTGSTVRMIGTFSGSTLTTLRLLLGNPVGGWADLTVSLSVPDTGNVSIGFA
jgi:hypothetical protein